MTEKPTKINKRQRNEVIGLQFAGLVILSFGVGTVHWGLGLISFGLGLLLMGIAEERS